jgi:hypothetical protein
MSLTLGPMRAVLRRSAAALPGSKAGPTRAVSTPTSASARADASPAGPVPITIASNSVMAVKRQAALGSHRLRPSFELHGQTQRS